MMLYEEKRRRVGEMRTPKGGKSHGEKRPAGRTIFALKAAGKR
jgi:hypothetical protein